MNKNLSPSVETVTTASPERGHDNMPTVAMFREKLIELEFALRNNPRSSFDPSEWLNDTESNTDSAVYARMLDSFGEDFDNDQNKKLDGYQLGVLEYIQNQIDFNNKQAALDMNDDQVTEAASTLLQSITQARESVPEPMRKNYDLPLRAVKYTSEYAQPDSTLPQPTGEALATFVTAFEKDDKSDEAKAAKLSLFEQMMRTRYVAMTYGMLSKERSTPASTEATTETARTPEQQEMLDAANEKLDELRQELATLNAKREKRMWGIDAYKGDARYSPKNKALYAKYHAASLDVFRLLNPDIARDATLTMTDKIRKIAEHTVDEAKKLDLAILESYRNSNTKFGKLLEKYGRLHVVPKVILGVGASAVAGFFTGGAGTFATSGTLMAASFNARQRQQRADGANMLNFDADELMQEYASTDEAFEYMHARIRSDFENRISKAQSKTRNYTLGSYAVAGAIGAGTHTLPGGWFDGSKGLLSHDAVTDASAAPNVDPPLREGPPVAGGDVPPAAPEYVMELHTGMSDVYAHSGMGMYEAAQKAGFEISQSDLLRAAPDLYRYHLAYPMADGLPGIPIPGNIPNATIDILRYFATHH